MVWKEAKRFGNAYLESRHERPSIGGARLLCASFRVLTLERTTVHWLAPGHWTVRSNCSFDEAPLQTFHAFERPTSTNFLGRRFFRDVSSCI